MARLPLDGEQKRWLRDTLATCHTAVPLFLRTICLPCCLPGQHSAAPSRHTEKAVTVEVLDRPIRAPVSDGPSFGAVLVSRQIAGIS